MNTNETQEIEIPVDWDVTVQGAERRGYRAGVEAVTEWIHNETCPIGRWGEGKALLFQRKFDEFIYQLLAEQEKK